MSEGQKEQRTSPRRFCEHANHTGECLLCDRAASSLRAGDRSGEEGKASEHARRLVSNHERVALALDHLGASELGDAERAVLSYIASLEARAAGDRREPDGGTEEAWLVRNDRDYCWWRANRQGYSTDVLGAGVYSREEAEGIARHLSGPSYADRKESAHSLDAVLASIAKPGTVAAHLLDRLTALSRREDETSDTQRLDWLDRQREAVVESRTVAVPGPDGEPVPEVEQELVAHAWGIYGQCDTLRQAIDAAMQSTPTTQESPDAVR